MGLFHIFVLVFVITINYETNGQSVVFPTKTEGGRSVTWMWHPVQVSSLLNKKASGPSFHFQLSNVEDGSYHFGYNTDSERDRSFREEKRSANGKVTGSYGYRDPDGIVRITTYEADERGFRSTSRESSVDVHDDHASPFGNTDGIHVIGPIPKPFSALFVV